MMADGRLKAISFIIFGSGGNMLRKRKPNNDNNKHKQKTKLHGMCEVSKKERVLYTVPVQTKR